MLNIYASNCPLKKMKGSEIQVSVSILTLHLRSNVSLHALSKFTGETKTLPLNI